MPNGNESRGDKIITSPKQFVIRLACQGGVSIMPRINEATDTDPCLIHAGASLKVIERLHELGWKCEKGNILKPKSCF